MVTPVVAIVSPGAMGSAVGRRLTEHGLEVRTSLVGRSHDTAERAHAAGMIPATDEEIASSDLILSIVPPGDAVDLAHRLAPMIDATGAQPFFADCNAVSPATAQRIATVFEGTRTRYIDAGIVGGPPGPGARDPRIYVSGAYAAGLLQLVDYGLDVREQEGPIGAASAMKLSYSGMSKGLTALGAAMILAATRAGTSETLLGELASSQPEVLDRLARTVDQMYPKAYRYIAEMQELAAFAGDDPAAKRIFEGAAMLYERLADDLAGDGREIDALRSFTDAIRERL